VGHQASQHNKKDQRLEETRETIEVTPEHDSSHIERAHWWWRMLKPVRITLGWISIGLGLLTVWMPIPIGVPLLVVGALLVGTRSPAMRRAGAAIEWLLRRWAAVPIPIVRDIGQRALAIQQEVGRRLQ
jgi:hypothetical protein